MSSLCSIQTGRVAPLGPRRVPSGFVKEPVAGPAMIHAGGVQGDAQADLTVHGGADKAVYAYAAASYAVWRADHPQHDWRYGALAENLTIAGITEEEACIGDVIQIGTATLHITQPREPCYKFALRFADQALPPAMVRNGRCGWYLGVLAPGEVQAGDAVTLVRRPNPDWPVIRMHRFIHRQHRAPGDAEALADLPGLAASWQERARRLARSGRPQ